MNINHLLIIGASALAPLLCGCALAGETEEGHYMRIAEIEIDPAQLEAYKVEIGRASCRERV